MKRVKGYWHVRVMGIWLPAGETIGEAFAYASRMFEAIEAK